MIRSLVKPHTVKINLKALFTKAHAHTMKQSVILTMYGRVQGVGLRYFVKQKADQLRVTGFVRNLANGNVYMEAEGEETSLQLFIHYCRQGPSHARVDKTDIQYCPVQGFEGFEKR